MVQENMMKELTCGMCFNHGWSLLKEFFTDYIVHVVCVFKLCTSWFAFVVDIFPQMFIIHKPNTLCCLFSRAVGCIFGELLNNSPLFPVSKIMK